MVSLKSFAVKEPAYVLYSFFLSFLEMGGGDCAKVRGQLVGMVLTIDYAGIRKGLIWPGGEPPLPTEPP